MKVIVSFSGGKDSLASLLWVRNNLTKDFITVFCDTGWEHPLTYKYIEEVQEQLGLNLITVKSKKFNGMVDLTKKKSTWVMWKAQIFFVKRSQGVGMSMKNGTNAKRTRKTCHQLEHIAF